MLSNAATGGSLHGRRLLGQSLSASLLYRSFGGGHFACLFPQPPSLHGFHFKSLESLTSPYRVEEVIVGRLERSSSSPRQLFCRQHLSSLVYDLLVGLEVPVFERADAEDVRLIGVRNGGNDPTRSQWIKLEGIDGRWRRRRLFTARSVKYDGVLDFDDGSNHLLLGLNRRLARTTTLLGATNDDDGRRSNRLLPGTSAAVDDVELVGRLALDLELETVRIDSRARQLTVELFQRLLKTIQTLRLILILGV